MKEKDGLNNMEKQSTNNINITGVLVSSTLAKKSLVDKVTGQPYEAISGELVIRTMDGSEHEVSLFSKRLTKTGAESKMFTSYNTIMTEYKSLEKFPEEADVISVNGAEFGVNDYKNKEGEIKTFTQINGKFVNRVTLDKIETTPQIATFEVEGQVVVLAPETYKNEPTGNGEIQIIAFGYGGTIIPIKLIVPKELVEGFGSVGFFETGMAKLTGNLINTKEVKTVVEKQSFGADLVKEVTNTVRRFEVLGGSPKGTIYDFGITDVELEQAKTKRRLKLEEVRNRVSTSGQQQGFTAQATGQASQFGQTNQTPTANPFAKQ